MAGKADGDESLKRIVRNVFTMAVECRAMTPEELEGAEPGTLEGMTRPALERLAAVARWAAEALAAESVRR